MKVLFIYYPYEGQNPLKPLTQYSIPLGISYISSLLKDHGYETEGLVLNTSPHKITIQTINRFQPKLICFTATTMRYPFIAEIASYIKSKYPSVLSS